MYLALCSPVIHCDLSVQVCWVPDRGGNSMQISRTALRSSRRNLTSGVMQGMTPTSHGASPATLRF